MLYYTNRSHKHHTLPALLPHNQKYNPNTIHNTQNDKKTTSNAVLSNLETYEDQHKYFIGTLLNESDQNFGYHMGDTITFFLYGGEGDERALVSNMNEIM